MPEPQKERDLDERVSMHGVDAEAALRALLQVDLNADPADAPAEDDDGSAERSG